MKRILWLAAMTLVSLILFYASRYWTLRLWGRDGLFGLEALRPQGNLFAQWLRGTELLPFSLLIWAIACFILLTWLQKLSDFFAAKD